MIHVNCQCNLTNNTIWKRLSAVVYHPWIQAADVAMLASTVPLLGQQNASSEGNKEEKMSPLTQSILTTLMFVIKLFSGAVSNKTLSLLELMLISFFCEFSEPACQRIIDSTFPLLLEQLTQDVEASVNEILPSSLALD